MIDVVVSRERDLRTIFFGQQKICGLLCIEDECDWRERERWLVNCFRLRGIKKGYGYFFSSVLLLLLVKMVDLYFVDNYVEYLTRLWDPQT